MHSLLHRILHSSMTEITTHRGAALYLSALFPATEGSFCMRSVVMRCRSRIRGLGRKNHGIAEIRFVCSSWRPVN
jgi:hypothetical protein